MRCIVVSNGMQIQIVDANSEGNKAIVGKFKHFVWNIVSIPP